MNIELSEIIYSSDHEEYAPKLYLGLLLFVGASASSTFDNSKPDGLVSNVEVASTFSRSIDVSRTLTTNVQVTSSFVIYVERLDRILTDPGFTPADRQSAGTYSLPAIVGGPPAFDLGDLPGVYVFTLESGSKSITLKAPEMGNEDRYKPDRVVDTNFHKSLRVFKPAASGPGTSTLTYSFSNLLENEKEQLKTFLSDTVGKLLTLTEHTGKIWYGHCTTEDPTFTEDLEYRYQITLTFETRP